MNNYDRNISDLAEQGFIEIPFSQIDLFKEIQTLVQAQLPCSLEEYHLLKFSQGDHLQLAKKITDEVAQSGLVRKLIFQNRNVLQQTLGPDLDVQAVPHLRISRPDHESDLVGWHRDTFYGNTPWEMNLWFPVFDLMDGAGLMVVPGSHVIPMRNVRSIEEDDSFRRTVTKGSLANQMGYTYSAKTDDLIAGLRPEQARLLKPATGSAVFFFGCIAHRATNKSSRTRVSIDVRVRNIHTRTNTRPEYYESLCREPVYQCIQKFLGL